MSVSAARGFASQARQATNPLEAVRYIERAIDELGRHITDLEDRFSVLKGLEERVAKLEQKKA
jgi:hypothetical protein